MARWRAGASTETPDEIEAFDDADTFANFALSSGGSWLNKATPMPGASRLERTALRDGSGAPVRIVVTAALGRRADSWRAAALDAFYQFVGARGDRCFSERFYPGAPGDWRRS